MKFNNVSFRYCYLGFHDRLIQIFICGAIMRVAKTVTGIIDIATKTLETVEFK